MAREVSRRAAERVSLQAPAQILGPLGPVDAQMRDLSRTGVRIRLKSVVSPDVPFDLLSTTQQLQKLIGNHPTVKLDAERAGPTVSRKIRVTRVVLPSDDQDAVDVGCRFDRALTDEDTTVLGVALLSAPVSSDAPPPRTEKRTPSLRVQVPPPPSKARESVAFGGIGDGFRPIGYQAHISGRGVSLECTAEAISTEAIVLQMKRATVQHRDVGNNMIKVVSRLASRFGGQVRLSVACGTSRLWSGVVRITGADLPDDRPDIMCVSFSFLQPLDPRERSLLRF